MYCPAYKIIVLVSSFERVSFITDFETTFALHMEELIAEDFNSTELQGQGDNFYVKCLALGCDLHAKRTIREKCNISEDNSSL